MSNSRALQVSLFFILLLLVLILGSPPIALVLGLVIGIFVGHPYPKINGRLVKQLLQYSVIGLGFGMNLETVIQVSQTGMLMAVATMAAGYLLGRLLGIERKISYLISAGSAICGGSAIAAVGPVLEADEKDMSVSLGTVFILNSVALLVFPVIGHLLNLSQHQFGLWAAIAIHDTSSVVGASAKYGTEALMVATTVKLARALWIVPLALLTAWLFRQQSTQVSIPYFILWFLVASVLHTYIPVLTDISPVIVHLAKLGLTVTLFLIGAGLSKTAIRAVGIKPMIQGILLWIFISAISLWAILFVASPQN
jgi:uncharacterized integral membrane protein (TIGR00698 family)